ncbi:hypothetical protein B0H66DRAFT_526966 [Apodospora peruviana]|uniref:SUZ domain-containing protein n=1 Tax=Apodospora peruviana TaxID=516989 RepID=A0AAE0MFB2_9PEZI|nr:hypothetical protein B0H66DRAFT_526966 [Apodospora peruviana]
MAKNAKSVPDAWDDDWESIADRAAKEAPEPEPEPEPEPQMTRAERLAKHAEAQRKLWESAEAPEEPAFLPINNAVPPLATTPFKPAMKVLSRKPAPKVITKRDPVTGLEQLTIQDDFDDEDEDRKNLPTPEEVRLRQQREREEKQRRYDEARAKIFGEPSPSSGQSTPASITPPRTSNSGDGRQNYRGRGGRGRGGRGGSHRNINNNDSNNNWQENKSPRPPSNQQQPTRELFDPSYSPKPGFNIQRRGGGGGGPDMPPQPGRSSTPREEDQIIRVPKGPDASGRGFSFAKREPQ